MRWILRTAAVAALVATLAGAQGQPLGGTPVSFATSDSRLGTLDLAGRLWTPADKAKGSVVLVHGSGGWSDHREGHYGRALAAAGYAVLAIDSFGPRGIASTTEDQSQVSSLQMTRDAFAARRFLLAQGFAAKTVAVMGFSKGGAVALFAADGNFLPAQTERFAAAVAFYPACSMRSRTPRPVGPLFIALGEKDDYSGVAPCQDLAAAFRQAAGQVQVTVYPGASHGFDGNPAMTGLVNLRLVENYMNCLVLLEDDGSLTFNDKHYAASDTTLLADMRRTCMRRGATLWTNPRQKEAATRDVVEFLDAALAR